MPFYISAASFVNQYPTLSMYLLTNSFDNTYILKEHEDVDQYGP